MWNHRDFWVKKDPFLWFQGSIKAREMLEKDPFSHEIQTDDTYPTCQTMTLPGYKLPSLNAFWVRTTFPQCFVGIVPEEERLVWELHDSQIPCSSHIL